MIEQTEHGWPTGDPRRFFDAPIDPAHLRASSPNVYRRAWRLAVGVVVGGGLVGLGIWALVAGFGAAEVSWPLMVAGVVAVLAGVGLLLFGLLTGGAATPYRGGQLVPGMVVEHADADVQILTLADTSRDPAAPPDFAYRLVSFHAREGTRFVPGQPVPCVAHGFVAPPWSRRWWSFQASPVAWATAEAELVDAAGRAVPAAEWDLVLSGAERVADIRRRLTRVGRIAPDDLPESLRRPPTRLGVPVEWQADGRARFVGSVAHTTSAG
ncbi:hypothetical protein B1813_19820 [Saccharomonospora piscinae]|uniref:DUF3239 domain-containing protein n=1 Tax=Saccharomonospora piscinae TaxID=687388 RepID=A0A1V8ZYR7_SACPI|nr:DUF3239 domain-containing protein [Saccharomonospora piscinae]OQO90069.1 hypothetical protein B1813_19820 [Saccharomonospora piscinae]TLW90899.1 DUF3239 domain-containing protein [Saccharomonospora piscinae]